MLRKFLHRMRRLFFSDGIPEMVWGFRCADGRYLKQVRISNTTFIGSKEKLDIHDNVFIGHFNFIDASNGLTIEEGCQVTNYISILTHSSHISIRLYGSEYTKNSDHIGYLKGSVSIGKYSFIGPHSVIMPGSNIGKGSLVSAYSYVSGTFPEFAIIAGNPAKVVGDTRELDKKYLEDHPEVQEYYNAWTK